MKIRIGIVLSTSAFNSCMIEFSIPDYNETIIKNIFKHWTSWSCVRTQWFIGQYCSEWEGRGYYCRYTSVPLSLYFISILWRLVITAFRRRPRRGGFFLFQTIIGAQVWFFFLYFYNAFPRFFFYIYYTA